MHKFHRYNAIVRTTMLISVAFAATLFTRSCNRKAPPKKRDMALTYNEQRPDITTEPSPLPTAAVSLYACRISYHWHVL